VHALACSCTRSCGAAPTRTWQGSQVWVCTTIERGKKFSFTTDMASPPGGSSSLLREKEREIAELRSELDERGELLLKTKVRGGLHTHAPAHTRTCVHSHSLSPLPRGLGRVSKGGRHACFGCVWCLPACMHACSGCVWCLPACMHAMHRLE